MLRNKRDVIVPLHYYILTTINNRRKVLRELRWCNIKIWMYGMESYRYKSITGKYTPALHFPVPVRCDATSTGSLFDEK